MGQGQRADRIGIARKGYHAYQIIRPAGQFVVITIYKFSKHRFDHIEPGQQPAVKFHFRAHASGTVHHHLNGNSLTHLENLFRTLLGPGKGKGQKHQYQNTNQERQPEHLLYQGTTRLPGM